LRGFEAGHQVWPIDCGETLNRSSGGLCLRIVGRGSDCNTARAIPAGARDPNDREKEEH
jgi:hypothetical protein